MRTCTPMVVACVLALSACALNQPPPQADIAAAAAPNLKLPAQWVAAQGGATAPGDNWIANWHSPELDALVAEALAYNSDLAIAAARVELAAAYLKAASSPIWPQVNLVARGGGEMSGDSSGLQGVGLFATWELDVWGRVRAEKAATGMQLQAAQLDAAYARQSITAMVAKAWVLAIEARLARARTADMQTASSQLAALARERLRVGAGDEYAVAVAQANVETFNDSARTLDLAYQNAQRALETLVGRYPGATIAVPDALPRWPGAVPAGLPSELLERRPDMVAAERRVASAFYATEEAKAARLPRFSLVANVTTLSSEMFVLKDRNNPVFSAGAGLVQPIFFGGYLQSQVEARTAEQKAAIADYGKTSAKVFGEVEGALAAGQSAAEREQILTRSVTANARALDLANVRYRVGSADQRAVEQQQLALYTAQMALLRVQSEQLVQRVNLHLALGGSFDLPLQGGGAEAATASMPSSR